MSITYEGIPLLLPDDQEELQAWFDKFMPLDDLRLFGAQSVERAANRQHANVNEFAGVGIPRPNYPAAPRLKLNTLHLPTGATRWATFIGLTDTDSVGGFTRGAQLNELVLRDGDVTITLLMAMLTPRPVTVKRADGDDPPQTLWLLPLVDQRYFWQNRPLILELDPDDEEDHPGDYIGESWLLDQIEESLDIEILKSSEISPFGSFYNTLALDNRTVWRRQESCGAILDGLLHSTAGARLTLQPGMAGGESDFKIFSFDDSLTQLQTNLGIPQSDAGLTPFLGHTPANLVAGGPIEPPPVPWKVDVSFRELWNGIINRRESIYGFPPAVFHVETANLTDVLPGDLEAYSANTIKKNFFTTMFAWLPDEHGTDVDQSSHLNSAALADLAIQLAGGFYMSMLRSYDYVFAGLKEWTLTAYCDYVEWSFGDRRCGEYTAITRVVSMPPDVGVSENVNQDTSGEPTHVLMEYPDTVYGITQSQVPPYDDGEPLASLGSVLIWTPKHEDIGLWEGFDNIKVFNFSAVAIAGNQRVICSKIGNRWAAVWDDLVECYFDAGSKIRLRQAAREPSCPP